ELRDLLREDGVARLEDLRQRQRLRAQRVDEDRRVGGVDLAVARAERQVGRQVAAGGVDGGLHVARGGLDVAIEIELQRDRCGAQRRRRGHLVDAGDAAEA